MEAVRLCGSLLLLAALGCSGGAEPQPILGTAGSAPLGPTTGGMAATSAGSGGVSAGAPTSSSAGAPVTGGVSGAAGTAAGGSSDAGSGGAPVTGGVGGAGGGAAGKPSVDPGTLPNVTLHLAGDSTVMTYEAGSAQEGWGQELPPFLLSKVALDNQAIGGASVETFYTGRWKNVMSNLKAGDYVMAAFGANDSGSVEGRHVEPADFQKRYEVMAEEVKGKQATFIAVTPSALQEWSGGKQGNQRLGPYVSAIHAFAESKGVKLADLNARSLEFLNMIGQEAAKEIYIGGDKAHFTKKGATQMAQFVAQELQRSGSPLGAYVK